MGNAIDIEHNENTFTLSTGPWWKDKTLNTAAQDLIFVTQQQCVPIKKIHRAYNHPTHRGKVSVLKAYPAAHHTHNKDIAINILSALSAKKKLVESQQGMTGIYKIETVRYYITLVALAPDDPFLIYISTLD